MAAVPGLVRKNQLGGTGPDADGGKGRTQFEDDRRGGNQGGTDRPPVYKPKDDGERGGYKDRSKPIPADPKKKKRIDATTSTARASLINMVANK